MEFLWILKGTRYISTYLGMCVGKVSNIIRGFGYFFLVQKMRPCLLKNSERDQMKKNKIKSLIFCYRSV